MKLLVLMMCLTGWSQAIYMTSYGPPTSSQFVGVVRDQSLGAVSQLVPISDDPSSQSGQRGYAPIPEEMKKLGLNLFHKLIMDYGLGRTLQEKGPFTVFAVTDKALKKLPPKTLQRIKEDPKLMQNILKYHIVPGDYKYHDISVGQISMETFTDDAMKIFVTRQIYSDFERVTVNNARVSSMDNPAFNGVIHVLDAMLSPPLNGTIADVLEACPQFDKLLTRLEDSNLTSLLRSENNTGFTLFAPVNKAFQMMAMIDGDASLEEEANGKLVKGHIVRGAHYSSTAPDKTTLHSLDDTTITLGANNHKLVDVNNARTLRSDIVCTNGVIHVIDRVLEVVDLCDVGLMLTI